MKACIILGSPRKNGHTAELLKPVISRLGELNCETEYIWLGDKTIAPCLGCKHCQYVENSYGCVQKDDAEEVLRKLSDADFCILATPIYSWYCTPEMKALIDRHYGMNKYYGNSPEKKQVWDKARIALITTHGYKDAYANEPFETGIKRLCKHCGFDYLGLFSARDIEGFPDMQTPEVTTAARDFAEKLVNTVQTLI